VGAGYRNLLASNALLELPGEKLVQMLVDGGETNGTPPSSRSGRERCSTTE
jgi:hypothetical protein